MIPVVTPEEMRAIDAAAPEPVDVLIERAGWQVYRHALDMLGGTYGRRVVVVAGKGNNGADGRSAARFLDRRGVRVTVIDATDSPRALSDCDLVIDAAYGTGFHGTYEPPKVPGGALVLAVDVPSGNAVHADATVTFAALKPGLLFADPDTAGVVTVVDIGLDVSDARAWLVEPADVRVPTRAPDAHKYASGVAVVGGSPGMTGAPLLCARAAMRAGAGYVRLGVPGVDPASLPPTEAVGVSLPAQGWAEGAIAACDRMRALAIGPGLAPAPDTAAVLNRVDLPTVVDGGALSVFGRDVSDISATSRPKTVLLTPHEGEFERMGGKLDDRDRLEATRELAAALGATVLLKGRVTTVADPDGIVWLSATGTSALATAGTGDVLTGIAAAFLARGLNAREAGAYAACMHGLAALSGPRHGLVAGDLPELLPKVLT